MMPFIAAMLVFLSAMGIVGGLDNSGGAQVPARGVSEALKEQRSTPRRKKRTRRPTATNICTATATISRSAGEGASSSGSDRPPADLVTRRLLLSEAEEKKKQQGEGVLSLLELLELLELPLPPYAGADVGAAVLLPPELRSEQGRERGRNRGREYMEDQHPKVKGSNPMVFEEDSIFGEVGVGEGVSGERPEDIDVHEHVDEGANVGSSEGTAVDVGVYAGADVCKDDDSGDGIRAGAGAGAGTGPHAEAAWTDIRPTTGPHSHGRPIRTTPLSTPLSSPLSTTLATAPVAPEAEAAAAAAAAMNPLQTAASAAAAIIAQDYPTASPYTLGGCTTGGKRGSHALPIATTSRDEGRALAQSGSDDEGEGPEEGPDWVETQDGIAAPHGTREDVDVEDLLGSAGETGMEEYEGDGEEGEEEEQQKHDGWEYEEGPDEDDRRRRQKAWDQEQYARRMPDAAMHVRPSDNQWPPVVVSEVDGPEAGVAGGADAGAAVAASVEADGVAGTEKPSQGGEQTPQFPSLVPESPEWNDAAGTGTGTGTGIDAGAGAGADADADAASTVAIADSKGSPGLRPQPVRDPMRGRGRRSGRRRAPRGPQLGELLDAYGTKVQTPQVMGMPWHDWQEGEWEGDDDDDEEENSCAAPTKLGMVRRLFSVYRFKVSFPLGLSSTHSTPSFNPLIQPPHSIPNNYPLRAPLAGLGHYVAETTQELVQRGHGLAYPAYRSLPRV